MLAGASRFCLQDGGTLVLIDPYLSDSLAAKYKNTVMIGHHFGMFDFKPVDLPEAKKRINIERYVNCFLAEIGKQYVINKEVNKCRQETKS